MSFYDLTKDFVLSANDLFKYRVKRRGTLPSKGGQKDFEPDESWMQSKALEKFMQERASVLAEPRVEKLKNLVEATWDGERGLVNVQKTGKFWSHMGFTDKRRNWLYPEEALFLMECNTLEVYHGGLPLSIQEAYNLFLGADVSIEEYQVFSHLRRLGYVVLRHEDQPVITAYERQINLDKYINTKSRKEQTVKSPRKGKKGLEQGVESNGIKSSNHNSDEFYRLLFESVLNPTVDESDSKSEVQFLSDNGKDLLVQENPTSDIFLTSSSMTAEQALSGPDSLSKNIEQHTKDSTNHNSDEFYRLLFESVLNPTVDDSESKSDVQFLSDNGKDLLVQENPTSDIFLTSSSMAAEQALSGPDSLLKNIEQHTEDSTNVSHKSDSTGSLDSNQRKRPGSPSIESSHESAKRNCPDDAYISFSNSESVADVHTSSSSLNQDSVLTSARRLYENSWDSCFISGTREQSSTSIGPKDLTSCPEDESSRPQDVTNDLQVETNYPQDETKHKNSYVKTLPLPNIADTEVVVLVPPSPHLLPENVDIDEKPEFLSYDVVKYRNMNPPREVNKQAQREEEREKQIQGLQFSFPEWIQRKPKLAASSWKEYKQKLAEGLVEISSITPVDQLWKGKVTPLLHPGKRWSYQSILGQLSIIKSADNETLLPDSDCVVDVKVTYDVHLPDSRFKKSMPGVPNHRVCVSKCSSDLPGLAEIHQVWSRLKDDVPLHWAVVDSGEIAFYGFDSTRGSEVFV